MKAGRRAAPGMPGDAADEFLLTAPGLERPILFSAAAPAAETLAAITFGWHWRRAPAGPDAPDRAAIRIGRVGGRGGHVVDSIWLKAPLTGLSAVAAANSAACDIGLAYIEAGGEGGVGLHCGAVELGGRLVLLVGPRRAGKSTLVTRLGAMPLRVFTDDMLPLGPETAGVPTGVALGIAPRLRLPLPRGSDPAFRAHVAEHLVARDERYGYVLSPDLAPHGAVAPIGVILLIDRQPRVRARLRAATRAEALRLLVLRNLMPGTEPAPLLARLERLVDAAAVYRLEYSRLEDAARLVADAFAPGAAPPEVFPARAAKRPAVRGEAMLADAAPSQTVWHPRAGIDIREIEGEIFLCDPAERAILHLNPVGAAIWGLLASGGVSEAAAAEALAEAWPAVDPARIRADVVALFTDLRREGLIDPAETEPDSERNAALHKSSG